MIITKSLETEWLFLVFEIEFTCFRNYSFPPLELEFRAFGTKVSSRWNFSSKHEKQKFQAGETKKLCIAQPTAHK